MRDWTTAARDMVARLRARDVILRPDVEHAFRRVPRHLFLPAAEAHRAYTHGAIVTKVQDGTPISSSSDPAVMAIMIEQLNAASGARVLEIGTGTGYNAAILDQLVGADGGVFSVDIDDDICATARANLARAGAERVEVVCRDGAHGVPEHAPFDRIIVTVGSYELPPAWVEQLKSGGSIVVPIWVRGAQCLVAFEKRGSVIHSRSVRWGGFMRMRGALAGPEAYVTLANGWVLSAENPTAIDSHALEELLGQVPTEHDDLAQQIGPSIAAFSLFVAFQDPRVVVLTRGDDAGRLEGYAVGLVDAEAASLCLALSIDDGDQRQLHVRSYGRATMLWAMARYLDQWTALERPSIEHLQVTATPVSRVADERTDAVGPGCVVRGSFALSFAWGSGAS